VKTHRLKTEQLSSELESILRIFLLFLKEEPQINSEASFEKYVDIGNGSWNTDTLADSMCFDRLCKVEVPLRYRYALIAQVFSVFEAYAIKLADAIIDEIKPDALRIDHLRGGRSLSGVKVFYKQVFPVSGFDWRYIDYLENCRNIIVHANGYDTGVVSKSRINKMLETMQVIEFTSTKRLLISESACKTFVVSSMIFFEKLFEQCGHKMGHCSFSVVEPDEFQAFEKRHEPHRNVIVKLPGTTLFG